MQGRPDRLLVVGCVGLALTLVGALLGDRGAPLVMVGIPGTLLAFGGFVVRLLVDRRRGREDR